ncbi:regulatory ArsR family protein [Haloactinospora alba]|uniref:Regulatory ArsR family protein n=1 Tax=Haloactinospora alba TaxID=405555 RepID=A0A543N7J6_9ACTN|nr:helix-turn-helix domain-containing protein [Haloactinospora alba]TQN27792.1 regulatory ArsR family protein [Haloactinospora alba]
MSSIRLTPEDMGRVRFAGTTPVLIETVHAIERLLADAQRNRGWSRYARNRLASLAVVRSDLADASAHAPEALSWLLPEPGSGEPIRTPPPEGSARLQSTAAVLSRVLHTAVLPFEGRLRALQTEASARYGRLVASRGAAAALERLGDRARWNGGRLELADGGSGEVRTGGAGLPLLPSVFLESGPRLVLLPAASGQGPRPALVFPAFDSYEAIDSLVSESRPGSERLSRLLGQTRAAILAEVVTPMSTSELAAALYVSPTTISEHTAVLRDAGLITTSRDQNRVRHQVTRLGVALLHSHGADAGGELPGPHLDGPLSQPA